MAGMALVAEVLGAVEALGATEATRLSDLTDGAEARGGGASAGVDLRAIDGCTVIASSLGPELAGRAGRSSTAFVGSERGVVDFATASLGNTGRCAGVVLGNVRSSAASSGFGWGTRGESDRLAVISRATRVGSGVGAGFCLAATDAPDSGVNFGFSTSWGFGAV